ncbi:MAG: apolipoprotein N-acyltransferase [Candidatus Omnitrophota bacterium]|jgi:apolipoprotein N-acyltransferase
MRAPVIQRVKALLPWALVGLSGLLLFLAFAPFEWASCIWFALVPWLLVLSRPMSRRRSMLVGWVAGASFWLPALFFLHPVTWAGYLILYCALFFVPFSLVMAAWLRRFGVENPGRNIRGMLVGGLVWVGSEYLRNHLFTGFPMDNLAVSQYRNLSFIQIADIGGEHLVSFVIAVMNLAVGFTLLRYASYNGRRKAWPHWEMMCAVLLVILSFMYSLRQPIKNDVASQPMVLTCIQPNIPQDEKFVEESANEVYRRVFELTDLASLQTNVQLIVWPETAIPDYVNTRSAFAFCSQLAAKGVPILAGAMRYEYINDRMDSRHFNSTVLFDEHGDSVKHYDKQHLVLLGEYVPAPDLFPWLKKITAIPENFAAGTESTIFELDGIRFSPLICFEDMIPGLARNAVQAGARLLINQTNDAWYDPWHGSRQHAAHFVFRCIENRVPAVRATNTGLTCAIDRLGRMTVEGPSMQKWMLTTTVQVPDIAGQTIYSRWGDWLGIPAMVFMLGTCFCIAFSRRKFQADRS